MQHSEDQIFSILAPLSILSAPSSSPSPVAGTPENEATATFASAHPKIASWLPGTANGLYPIESAEWASATASPPASPPSISPPSSANIPAPRRNTLPQRKAESKLRSVLPSIDEKQSHSRSPLSNSATPRPPISRNTSEYLNTPIAQVAATTATTTNISPPSSSSNPDFATSISSTLGSAGSTTSQNGGSLFGGRISNPISGAGWGFGSTWNFGYGQSPYSPTSDDEGPGSGDTASTPRMSTLFSPSSTTVTAPVSVSGYDSPPPPPELNHHGSVGGPEGGDKPREDDDQKPVYDPLPA